MLYNGKSQKLSRRKFLSTSATVAGAAALAACTPAAPTAVAVISKPKPKLVIWCGVTYTPEADSVVNNQIYEWCANHNIDVELNRMSGDERLPKWKVAFETKEFPDLGALDLDDQPKAMSQGLLLETTDIIERLNKLEGGYTTGSFINSSSPDGKHWSVPSFSSTEVFYVRKDKLKEKGLALPETWDQVVEVAKAITVPGEFWGWGPQVGTPSYDSEVHLSSTMWAYGAKTWDESGKVAVDSAETRSVLNLFNDAWKAGIIPSDAPVWDDSSNNKAYLTGITGMIWNTPSVLARMEKENPELLANTEIMLIPKGPKGRFTAGYFYQWGAFKNSKYPEESKALMEYLMAPDQLRPAYELSAGNMMPVFNNMINDQMFKKSPQRETLAKMVEFTVPQGYPGANKPWIQTAWMGHTMATMFGRVLFESWDNDKAIAEASAALQKSLDEWQA